MLEPILMTKKEAQVVTLLFDGHDPRRIAYLLGMSSSAVRSHLNRVYAKAGVSGACSLVALAWNNGGFLY